MYLKNYLLFKFNDIFYINKFIRCIDNVQLHINNDKLLYIESEIKNKSLSKSKINLVNNLKLIILDIETYKDENNIFIPYSCRISNTFIYIYNLI